LTAPTPVFHIWNADGSVGLSVLQSVTSWAISDVFCDVGSLTLGVLPGVAGASDLLVDEDRQVRVKAQGAPDLWFVLDEDAWAGVSDAPDTEPRTVACRSLAAVLDEVHVTAETAYAAVTPGAIVEDVFDDSQGRGFLQNLTMTGDATVDAGGDAWPTNVTVTYRAGTSLLAVLKGLSEARLLEWRINARALEIYKPGGDLDRSITGTPLRPGADVAAAPVQRSRRSIATDVMVVEEDGTTTLVSQSLTGRRRREGLVQQSTGSDTNPTTVANLYLAAHDTSDVQLTHDLQDGDDTMAPFVDYRCGDRLQTIAAGGGVTSWRVAQIAMAGLEARTSVTLELGSILQSNEERFAAQLAQLQPGAVVLT
jgi:hypothetical protein